MSKNLILIAALAIMATGCSQEQEIVTSRDVNDAITFEAYTGRSAVSRATQITTNNLDKFYVFATQHDGYIHSGKDCDGFMSNYEVVKSVGENDNVVWSKGSSEVTKYWENDDNNHISFFAVAPEKPTSYTTDGIPSTSSSHIFYTAMQHSENESDRHKAHYEFTFKVDGDVSKQVDLMWATALNKNRSDDNGTVKFAFKHALAAIGFRAKQVTDYGTNVTIKINKIEVIGKFYNQALLSLPIPAETEVGDDFVTANFTQSASWSNQEKPASDRTFTIGSTEKTLSTINSDVYGDNAYLMVIPQTFQDNNSGYEDMPSFRVTYTVTQGWSEPQKNEITCKFQDSNEAFSLQAGNLYLFNLTVALNNITFEAKIADEDAWKNAPGIDKTVE